MAAARVRQGDPNGKYRTRTVGAAVSVPEEEEIAAALDTLPAENRSGKVRLVLLTVARNPAVREVLLSHLPKAA